MAVQGKELAVGQVWVTGIGTRVRLTDRDDASGAYEGSNGLRYSPDGVAIDIHKIYQRVENLASYVGMNDQQVPPHRPPAQYDSAKVHVPLPAPEYTGGSVSYYTVKIANPTSGGAPYEAECNDIIEALKLSWAEANVFKAIWRRAAAQHLGLAKKGYCDGLYDAEKIVFFGNRLVVHEKSILSLDGSAQ